jgi:hypothetical protein
LRRLGFLYTITENSTGGTMSSADSFRRVAQRYDYLAQQATTEIVRRRLREIALENERIAERVTAAMTTEPAAEGR